MDEVLFEEHRVWAEGIAKSVQRRLPPSFELADLQQAALIAHWHCVEKFDSVRGVPYRAYAYYAIQGAVLMSCRRREYRESTHDELGARHVDQRASPEGALIERSDRNNAAAKDRRKLKEVIEALSKLDPTDAYLIRRVYLDGVEISDLAAAWSGNPKVWSKRLMRARLRLKRIAGK